MGVEPLHVLDEVPAAFIPSVADFLVAVSVLQELGSEFTISTEKSERLMCPNYRGFEALLVLLAKTSLRPVFDTAHSHIESSENLFSISVIYFPG